MTETPPERTPPWLTAGGLACLIVVFLFVLYPGVIFGTQSFFHRDFGAFTYPVAYYSHASFWRGEVPLWNPLNDSGVPFLAQWNTSVCYPLSLIYDVLPLPWSLNIFVLVHLVLAGFGMYLLAFRWTRNPLAASLAGVAFGLNGLMLNCVIWTSNLGSLAWQPWVILGVTSAWRLGGPRRLALAAFAGAAQMLAGAPEIIVFTWLMLAILWLAEVWQKKVPFRTALDSAVTVVVLVAGLSALQLLPFLDLLKHSERDASYVLADMWPMPVWGWANYLVPTFHSHSTTFGPWFQDGQDWTGSYYLGAAMVALVLAALWRAREFRIWWLAGSALAGLVLALGNGGLVYPALKHIAPLIGFARFPIKFVALPTFALPLLAAFGFARFQTAAAENSRRAVRSLIWIAGLILLAMVIILVAAYYLTASRAAWSATAQDTLVRLFFLLAIIGAMVALVRTPSLRTRAGLSLVVVLLAGLDLTIAGLRQNPVISTKAFGPLELNMSARPKLGEARALVGLQTMDYLSHTHVTDPFNYYVGLRGVLYENCNIPENVPKLGGFCSLHLRWEMDMLVALYGRTNVVPDGLADFLGVSQVSSPSNVFVWQSRSTALPMATGGQRPVFMDDAEVVRRMASDDFDPRAIVYLPPFLQGQVTATNAVGVKIVPQEFAAQRIRFDVEAAAPAIVVIAQTYHHNWQAAVDGRSVPLWPANHAFQALPVPAGQHAVTLVYQDREFHVGVILSALALAICLVLFLVPERR